MFRNWFYPKALTAIGTTDGYYEVREFAHANGCDEKQMLLVWMALAGSSPARLLQYTRDYMHECYPQEEDPPAVARWYAPSERIIVHRPVTGEPRLLNGDGSPGPGYVNQDR